MIKVLFVCLGNICRSPMAEAVFQQMINEANLSHQIKADSSGVSRYHIGEPAHKGTLAVLKKHNIPYNGRARTLLREDFDEFNYILVMDSDVLAETRSRQPKGSLAEVKLFLEYAPHVTDLDVPDPYYSGKFDEVYDLVVAGSQGLLTAIRETHGL